MFIQSLPRAVPALTIVLFLTFIRPVSAELLSFESVLEASLRNSFEIKINRANISAEQAFVAEKRADYYPKLLLRFGNEYVHAFEESTDVVSVGDAIIANERSGYKHSLIASLSYNLFDFGIRQLAIESAERQVRIAKLQGKQSLWELRKQILSDYSAALKLQKQRQLTAAILERQNSIFRLSRQLRQVGSIGREKVGAAALNLAETLGQLDLLKIHYQEALANLSFYARQPYLEMDVELADLRQAPGTNSKPDLKAWPEVRIFQQQIANKKAELSMAKRSLLPKLTLQGAYRMYGSDGDSFSHSLTNMAPRDSSVTLYLEWPLFNGFENRAKQARLRHEIDGLRHRQQQKQAELQNQFKNLRNSYISHTSRESERQRQREQISREKEDAQRLAEQQIIDQISFHNKMIRLTRQELEVALWQVELTTSTLALELASKASL